MNTNMVEDAQRFIDQVNSFQRKPGDANLQGLGELRRNVDMEALPANLTNQYSMADSRYRGWVGEAVHKPTQTLRSQIEDKLDDLRLDAMHGDDPFEEVPRGSFYVGSRDRGL